MANAAEQGKVLRYVGLIDEGRCKVRIEAVDGNDPLYKVKNGENALASTAATISRCRWCCAATAPVTM